jgi:hypothetical protein
MLAWKNVLNQDESANVVIITGNKRKAVSTSSVM